MSYIRAGLVVASLAWLAHADTPVIQSRVECTTHVTTSILSGPTPVTGPDGQYYCPACPIYGNQTHGTSDPSDLSSTCTQPLQSSIPFSLFWNKLRNKNPDPPAPIEMFTDYEFGTVVTVKDDNGFGFNVALDGKELGIVSTLSKANDGTTERSWKIPAGEHEVQVSWKDSNAHADAIEGHQFVTGEFKFDKIVDCGSSGGGGNSGGGGDSGGGGNSGGDVNNENGGTLSNGEKWKRIPDSNMPGRIGRPIDKGVKPPGGTAANCMELCAKPGKGCTWAAWIPERGTCYTYSSAVSEPYEPLEGNDLLVYV